MSRQMSRSELAQIAEQFQFGGRLIDARCCENGHINDTYIITVERTDGEGRRFILQRINHNVFESPHTVMRNIQLVCEHLRHKVIEAGGDPEREVINLIPTVDGTYLYTSPEGEYWRSYLFVEGARTYEAVEEARALL